MVLYSDSSDSDIHEYRKCIRLCSCNTRERKNSHKKNTKIKKTDGSKWVPIVTDEQQQPASHSKTFINKPRINTL